MTAPNTARRRTRKRTREMDKTNETNETDETISVGCRFRKSELAAMKADTGQTGDAPAVQGFVRKRLAQIAEAR